MEKILKSQDMEAPSTFKMREEGGDGNEDWLKAVCEIDSLLPLHIPGDCPSLPLAEDEKFNPQNCLAEQMLLPCSSVTSEVWAGSLS